jgi:hypothetical protein
MRNLTHPVRSSKPGRPANLLLARALPLISVGLSLIAGCKRDAPPGCASCANAKLTNQWCDSCKVGYVAGVPIKSKLVFDCLDAHGHDLDLKQIKCPSCQAAIPVEGFCEKCRIGWVRKQAYFSRLTYHLAKGNPCDPSTISCPVCRKNSEKFGWCDTCNKGMIGNVLIADRPNYDGGCRGYQLMRTAVEESQRCENCALAILTDNSCFMYNIGYKDGKVVKRPADRKPG